jgi:hypothetical protein
VAKNLVAQANPENREFAEELSEAEFEYTPVGWTKPRRFVVIRQRIKEKASEQMSFLPDERWRYQVIVTNLKKKPRKVWRFYNGRANVIVSIRMAHRNGWGAWSCA